MIDTDEKHKPRPHAWTRTRAALAVGGLASGLLALHLAAEGVGHAGRALALTPSVHGTLAPHDSGAAIDAAAETEAAAATQAARSFGWAALAGAGAVALGALARLGGIGRTVLSAATGLARAGAGMVVAGAKGLGWLGRTGVRTALLMGVSVIALGAAAGGGGLGSLFGAALGAGGMLGVFAGARWLSRRLARFEASFTATPV